MSTLEAAEPKCTRHGGSIELLIEARSKDLGGFCVRRALPAPARRTVGPFIFFDEMGPADSPPGEGINVRPHPHIGLAAVTFLFDGEILHRDSLGYVQNIRPGAVNLMTAGRGIVHSERTPPALLSTGQHLHGIQTWMALPENEQEIDPAFVHHPSGDLPVIVGNGLTTTVIIGSGFGQCSPVAVHADTLYLAQDLDVGAVSTLPDVVAERAVYVVAGSVTVGDCVLRQGVMAVVCRGTARLEAQEPSRVLVIGGEPIGTRHIWWNYVHSSQARIDQAKRDWVNGVFPRVPDDDEFIPLPAV